MDLKQLRHFTAVAQEMHFTRAARRLNIVQSALSASIAGLEAEFGVKLFDRTTRHVRLTAAGSVLYEQADAMLAAARQARLSMAALRDLQTGNLFVGTGQSLGAFIDLPAVLAEFHAIHPGVEVHLRQGSRVDMPAQIMAGELDLAFLPEDGLPDRLRAQRVVDQPMVLACSAGNPLTRGGPIAAEDLADASFIDFQPRWGTRPLSDLYFGRHDVTRHVRFEVSDLDTMLGLVARGLGVALVPHPIVTRFGPEVRAVMLKAPIRYTMAMAFRAAPGRAVDAFIGLPSLQLRADAE